MSDAAWPSVLERGEAGEPLAGEERSGDLAVWAPYDGRRAGRGASTASATAARPRTPPRRRRVQLRAHAGEPPETALKRCHEALRSTRGVVATLAWFDLADAGAHLDGHRQRGGPARAGRPRRAATPSTPPPCSAACSGWSLPPVRLVRTTLAPGDCLVMATDGIAADFGSSLLPGVPAPEQARRVLASHARGSDDALVVAVRYLP